ncbi:hypothetical protein GQ85_05330 [Rhodococcus rhodochrous]|nr:hypothetical protein GQ85_05330 [Rhodococcus rhodochrous]
MSRAPARPARPPDTAIVSSDSWRRLTPISSAVSESTPMARRASPWLVFLSQKEIASVRISAQPSTIRPVLVSRRSPTV